MSTKTSIKRIALVAVAALGFGMVSTVSANAAAATAWTVGTAATDTTAITLASATSAPTAGTSVTVNVGIAIGTVAGGADTTHGIFATYKGFVSAYPSGGFAQATAVATASGTTTAITGGTTSAATNVISVKETTATAGLTATTVTASSTAGVGSFTFTPPVAGTYTVKVWNDAGDSPDGVIGYNEAVQTIDIVVAARSAASASLSTVYQADALLPAAGTYAPSSTTDGTIYSTTYPVPTLCSKATGTQCANLLVTVKNSVNAAISTGWTFGAEISGSGNLGISDTDNTYTQAASSRSVSLTTPANNVFNVSVWPDGTAGVGTISVYATDSDGNKVVLAKKTVTFYGTLAKLAVVSGSQSYGVLKAGGGTSGIRTGLTATSDVPALLLVATDADGNRVAGQTISATSSDLTVVSASTVGEDLVADDASYLFGGRGYYLVDATSATSAVSGQKATVTYYVTVGGVKVSTTADFTIGGKPANTTLTFDKASYEPGEGMTITRTCKDASGNPCYDGYAAGAVTFSKAVSGTVDADVYSAGTVSSDNSRGAKTVYAPTAGGTFTATMTGKTNGATADIVATATVGSTESQAAVDAANEATDAANAATDAANAAAEAADAATAAAQDAQAAVAALATQVSSLIAGIKAQITSLTNLVIKIQKKVRA